VDFKDRERKKLSMVGKEEGEERERNSKDTKKQKGECW